MRRENKKVNKKRGFSGVEVLVGTSIVALILIFSVYAVVRFVNQGKDIADQTQALYLAEEALEMVRHIRDKKWSNIEDLTDGTTYYLDIDGANISTSTIPEVIGQFTRSFEIDSVERDGNDDIVSSGTPDDTSKYVTATVTWGSPASTVVLTTILGDINNP